MNPAFLDDMSWEMAEVYGAVTDQILINLARYFPYYESGDDIPKSAFTYQAQMLAQMGQVNRETVRIIRNGLADADGALKGVLEAAIVDSVRQTEPELYEAVKKGVFALPTTPVVAPNQMRAFKLYYEQAAEKLNLVNTVMLESTQSAYQQAVSGIVAEMDVVERIGRTQTALDAAAGETITGVSAWNQAVKHATDRMKEGGITGFIDHGGHHWSAESYVAMDVRTTTFNTARAAVWETNENFGNDLYLVSSHSGARPLCYPWQNKVISSMNASREVPDLDGNPVHVYAQDETSYGQPAGLFGINCGHYPTPFIPGISTADNPVQDKEANDKAYAESQEQRRLERKLREEKRDLAMAKAQGASDEEIKKLREKCRNTSQDIDDFCEQTGRARHRDREAVYTKREFPDQKKYDVSKFETEQKERLEEYWKTGGTQQGRKFQQMTPVEQVAPNTTIASPGATNIFGESIQFSEKLDAPKWDESKRTINTLASEFKTKLKTVEPGAHQAAGSVQISGTVMKLSSTGISTAIHEFAHSISMERQTKFKLYEESGFWKEIKQTFRDYRKTVGDNTANWISSYVHHGNDVDEFMAEAFTLAYMREKGLHIPDNYGADTVFSSKVLEIVRKYFRK